MGGIAETLPPATQAFILDAAGYIAGIDAMIADNAKLAESITVATDEMKVMEATAAQAAEAAAKASSAGAAGAGAGAGAAGAGAAAADEDALAAAERNAAEAARLEAEMTADLEAHLKLMRDSSLASADAQKALATANRTATTSIIGVADAQKAQLTRSAEATAAANKLAAEQSKATKEISKVGSATILAAGAFVAYGVKSASDYQAEIVKLGTSAGESGSVIGGKLTGNLKTASDALLKMSVDTGTSTHELTAGMYMVESAGYQIKAGTDHAADGLNIMKVAAQGARAEQAPLKDVTNALTTVMRDFNVPASDAARVMNTMTVAVGTGKMTMADFSAAISNVSPLAQQAGIKFGELSGAFATLTQHGDTARDAANNLTAVIRGMQAPNLQAVKEMDRLGISAVDVSKNLGQRGLVGTLEMYTNAIGKHMQGGQLLIDTLNKSKTAANDAAAAFKSLPSDVQALAAKVRDGSMTWADYNKAIKGLGPVSSNLGAQWETMQKRASGFSDLLKSGSPIAQSYMQALSKMTGGTNAMRAALQLTGQNLAETKDNVAATSAAWNKGGKDVKGFADAQQTMAFKIDQAKAAFHKMAITIGNDVIPPLIKLMSFFSKHEDIVKFGLALAGAFLGMAAAVKVVTTLNKVYTGISAVVKLVKSWEIATKLMAAAQWLLNVAMDANPIALIVIAIAALVAGFVYAWTHFKGFRDFWISAWHDLQAAAKVTWDFLETVWHGIAAGALWLWHNAIDPTWHGIEAAWHGIAAVAMWLWHNVFDPMWHGIVAWAHWWWNNIKPLFESFSKAVHLIADLVMWWWHSVLEPAYRGVGDLVMWWWHSIVEPAFHAVGAVIMWWYNSVVKPAFGLVMAAVHLLGDVFAWLWHNGIEPVFSGIGKTISGAVSLIVTWFHWWVNNAKTVLGWFGQLGALFGGWFMAAYNAVVGAIGRVFSFIAGIPGTVIRLLAGLYDDGLQIGKNLVIGLWNGLVSMGSWLWNSVMGWARSVIPGPIAHVLGISSPSKLMHTYGQYVGEGLALGIHSKHKRVWDAAAGLAKAAAAGVGANLPAPTFTTVSKLVTDAVPSLAYASSGGGYATASNTHLVTSLVPTSPTSTASTGSAVAGGGQIVQVHLEVHGSVVSQRDLENSVQQAILRINVRNPDNRMSLPAGR